MYISLYLVWISEAIFLTNVQTHSWQWWKMGVLPPKLGHNLWEEYLPCILFRHRQRKANVSLEIFDQNMPRKQSQSVWKENRSNCICWILTFPITEKKIFQWNRSISRCSLERKHFSTFSLNIRRNQEVWWKMKLLEKGESSLVFRRWKCKDWRRRVISWGKWMGCLP